MSAEFDPLDYHNLTNHVVERLLQQTPFPLSGVDEFDGAGVYALFYTGDLACYASSRSTDFTRPIYVGKAVPSGARKGGIESGLAGKTLYKRLGEHRKSIEAAENLNIDDFMCRYLVVKPLWITAAEQWLIERFRPLWNVVVDGFGLHDPGSRRTPKRSPWDTLHRGRAAGWSSRVIENLTEAAILKMIANHTSEED